MISRPTHTRKYSRSTTQRPSTSTTALIVRISSFGNNTLETGNPIHRQKQQQLYSVGSRFSPYTRRVAYESSPLGLGIFTKPSNYRPRSVAFQRNRTTLPRLPLQGDQFLRRTSVPAASIAAEAHMSNPSCLLHPDVLPKSLPCSGLRRSRRKYGRPPERFRPHAIQQS